MTISKDGYIAACKTFRVQKESSLRFKSVLTPMVFAHRISSSAGGIVKNNQVTLSFEPHSFVFDQDKSVYNGDVSIALNYLDPLELQTLETVPSDMSSINTSKELGSLTSFGMVHVELQASDGRKLQIKEGKYVEVSMALKDTHASAARSEVALWHFDYTTGLWSEAGTAVKENNQYKAKVPHFSWWTYGTSYPSVTLSGRIVDKDGDPLTNIYVHVHPVGEYIGGYGIVNLDGTFSGAVPKNVPLEMTIHTWGIHCFAKQDNPKVIPIGTLSFKTDVGDIVFDSPALKKFRVKGSFSACDGSKITDGWLNFYNEFHQPWYSWGFYSHVGTYVYKGLYAGLGIDYSHSKELFISKSESLTKMIINFDPNTGKAIDTTFVNGTLIQKGEINYKSIDIPLVLGFQKSIHKWNLGLECTDGLNIVLEATGKTFNQHLIVSRIESEKDMYKEKLGWSGKINACAAYHINHCTQIIAKPYYLWQMHPISTQNALIKPNGVLLV